MMFNLKGFQQRGEPCAPVGTRVTGGQLRTHALSQSQQRPCYVQGTESQLEAAVCNGNKLNITSPNVSPDLHCGLTYK